MSAQHTPGQAVPINLQLADVRQALFDEARSDAGAGAGFRYEAGRAVGLMGNAMDAVTKLLEAADIALEVMENVDGENDCSRGIRAAEAAIAKARGAA